MNLTRFSLKNPAALAVIVALLVLFGLLAILGRPLQLLPVMTQPQISVFNNWREAAPAEMESYIIEPQEQVLRRTPGVTEIASNVSRGQGGITLSFEVGTDMQQALINVINNLNQTPPLPADAGEPFVAGGGGQNLPNAASLQIYPLKGNPNQDMFSEEYQRVIDNIVEPRLNQIPGVARVNMSGRRPFEVSITFDPYRAAALGIPINAIASTVSRANDISGGFADVGRRQYTVRFLGQYDIDKLGELIVAWNGNRPIHLSEVAEIEKVNVAPFGINIRNGYPAYYILLQSAPDGNTVDILDHVNEAIIDLNQNGLNDVGLVMELSYDASVYIRRAISLVKNNLGLGIMLAVAVLWFFLRDRRATLIIAASIPLSLLAAFIGLQAFDLTLNVISLAGLAFSVGLVLDAAIIVQENIVRYRQQGESLANAVLHGANQVKGALFASTMTTVAIFLPILFLEGQEGQMFSDLALTLSIAVLASLLAALTLIPLASSLWLNNMRSSDPFDHWWDWLTGLVVKLTRTGARRMAWVVSLIVLSIGLAWGLMPKADFLPSAQADAVTVFFNTPPGVTNEIFETGNRRRDHRASQTAYGP